MAKRFLDQKLKDRNFDERKDDKIAAGAAVATENRETVPCGAPEDNVRGSVSSTIETTEVRVETDVILRSKTHVKEKVKVLSNWQAPPSNAEKVHYSFSVTDGVRSETYTRSRYWEGT